MFTPSKVQGIGSVSFGESRLILVSDANAQYVHTFDENPFSPLPMQPSVSVGNVAQLAVDVLINTLQLSRVGHLHHPSLLPLVGSAAYSHTTNCLHTAAEGKAD